MNKPIEETQDAQELSTMGFLSRLIAEQIFWKFQNIRTRDVSIGIHEKESLEECIARVLVDNTQSVGQSYDQKS